MDEEPAVALVTGAARGIGRAICLGLLERGLRVVGLDQDEAGLHQLHQACATTREGLELIPCDVSSEQAVAEAVTRAVERFGSLSALINNAAIAYPYNAPLEQLALSDWRRVMATNLDGVFICSKHCLPHLARRRGSIVNVASTRALMSEPHSEAYAASKGAVVAFTHALALSVGPAVRVNCISPGWIVADGSPEQGALRPTDQTQHPVGRVGSTTDVVELCGFLISSRAGFITGQNIVVDGGMTRKMIYAP